MESSKLVQPKTGIMVGMLLAHRDTNEIFLVTYADIKGFVTIECMEDGYAQYLSRSQLADYMITGRA